MEAPDTRFDPGLAEGWDWLRESPSDWTVENNVLKIRPLPGSLWGETNNAQNVVLWPLEEPGSFVADVRVRFCPESGGEQAGLLYYVSDDAYVKLVKEMVSDGHTIVLAREVDGKPAVVGKIPADAERAELRLVCDGGWLVGFARVDETQVWEQVGGCEGLEGGEVRLGLQAHGAKEVEQYQAEFQDLNMCCW